MSVQFTSQTKGEGWDHTTQNKHLQAKLAYSNWQVVWKDALQENEFSYR